MLRSRGIKLDFPRDQFYEQIQDFLSKLSADEQAELKSLVDWIEDYDRANDSSSATNARVVSTKGK